MGILNRIINILILLAAIAAVVFSFLLFSKREKLTNGWAQMASAIQTAAKTLDDNGNSGTSAAKDLAEEKLKHTNYDQLGQVLPKLKEHTSKIVVQRNDLADSVHKAAGTLSIGGVEGKELKSIASYRDQERIFSSKVQEFRSVRDGVSNGYAQMVRTAGGQISAGDFNNASTYRTAIAKANAAIGDAVNRRNTYASYLGQISRAIAISAPNLNSANYRGELAKALQAAQGQRRLLVTTQSQLNAEKNKSAQLAGQVAAQQRTINSHLASIQQKDNRIEELMRILDKDGTIKLPEKLLTGNEPECYKYVKGKIEYVDKDYGFVTIDIGKNYVFNQRYGIKDNQVLFPLTTGKILTVARDLNTEKPVFIGKIFVTKVGDNSAVCNLVDGQPERYKVGDTVYFSDDDIAAALKGDAKPATGKKPATAGK